MSYTFSYFWTCVCILDCILCMIILHYHQHRHSLCKPWAQCQLVSNASLIWLNFSLLCRVDELLLQTSHVPVFVVIACFDFLTCHSLLYIMSRLTSCFLLSSICTKYVYPLSTPSVHLSLIRTFHKPLLTYCLGALVLTQSKVRDLGVCWNDCFRKIFKYNRWESVSELCHLKSGGLHSPRGVCIAYCPHPRPRSSSPNV